MTAAAAAAPASLPEERPTGLRLKLITVALVMATLIQVFDTSIISIALHEMQGSLSATQDQMAWVLTSYLIAVAVMTPFWGAISGIFGRKPLLLISIAGFTLFSLLSGISDSLTEILIYRAIQGVFGAALIPLSQSALLAVYPREDFGVAMGWWGVGIMFGPVFGPTLGGYITEYWSWRWAFYLNVPICLVAFLMVLFLVPRTGNLKKRPFNYFGFVMLATSVACIQFVLDRGQRYDWFDSATIIVLLLTALATLWVFVVNSMTSATPFVDPLIFRDRNYVLGIVLRILFGAMLFGSLVLIPPFVQNLGGYPLIDAGLIMAPRGVGAMVAAFVAGKLLRYVDPRKITFFGMFLAAATMWWYSTFTEDIDMTTMLIVNFIQGIGFSCFIVPVNTVAFSTMASEQRDVGTAFYSLLNNLGRSVGIALLANLLARNSQSAHALLSEHVSPFSPMVQHLQMPEAWDITTAAGLMAINRVVTRQAEMIAYISDFQLLAIMIVACMPVLFLMRNQNKIKHVPA